MIVSNTYSVVGHGIYLSCQQHPSATRFRGKYNLFVDKIVVDWRVDATLLPCARWNHHSWNDNINRELNKNMMRIIIKDQHYIWLMWLDYNPTLVFQHLLSICQIVKSGQLCKKANNFLKVGNLINSSTRASAWKIT